MYENGFGVEKDFKIALNYFQQAADMGFASAQKGVGDFYYRGFGVPKDFGKAMEFYRKAAEQGLVDAFYSMGMSFVCFFLAHSDRLYV